MLKFIEFKKGAGIASKLSNQIAIYVAITYQLSFIIVSIAQTRLYVARYSIAQFKLDTHVYQTHMCSIDFSSYFLKLMSCLRVYCIYVHENVQE